MSQGEGSALGELYDRFAPSMLGLARKIVSSPIAAEDLVHEVFLEAWEKAARYDASRGSVRAWLLLRVRSRCIDFRRSADQARTQPVQDSFWGENVASPPSSTAPNPDCERVRAELLRLPAEQRDVLFLGYFEGLTSSEIAQRVGAPVGTVKTRVAAALNRLRGVFVEQDRGAHDV